MAHNEALKDKDEIGAHLERLRVDFETLSETVRRLASEGATSAKSQVNDATKRAANGATTASQQIYKDASAIGNDAINTVSATGGQIEAQIARSPMTFALAALGVGFAIGLFSRR